MDSRKLIYIVAVGLLLYGTAFADTGDRVEERFALARSIRAHEQLYERLLNGRGTR